MIEDCLSRVHPSWQPILLQAAQTIPETYWQQLAKSEWLPGPAQIFNAFSLDLANVRTILFGESPYPRAASANGYAFWDARVGSIWSMQGLSKEVNRATSLRNMLKLWLIAEGLLSADDTSQAAIARIPKDGLVQTLAEIFQKLLAAGTLLLNASLVLSERPVAQDTRVWEPFMRVVLAALAKKNVTVLLWGNLAQRLLLWPELQQFKCLRAEHPYNISFIHNAAMQEFFRPMHVLLA
jgi:uracil-DNA glycosylase